MDNLGACVFASWQPGIGDPTLLGWLTVMLYALAAGLAFRVAGLAAFPPETRRRERGFWIIVGILMMLLAVNKQLDLQSALTATGRCLAKMQGWYEDRRAVQKDFLFALAALSAVFLVAILALLRGSWSRTGLAVIGLVFVCGFVMMRAVGFHHFDKMLGVPVMGIRANGILEWTGPILIAVSGLMLLRKNNFSQSVW